jgi:hypothetical protein
LNASTIEKEKRPERGIFIRVITPASARKLSQNCDASLFNGGLRYPLSASLRQLKEDVAKHLSVEIQLPSHVDLSSSTNECNCILAASVAKHGISDMLRRRESNQMSASTSREGIDMSKECLICLNSLGDRVTSCANDGTGGIDCPLVSNAGCGHTFHHDCYVRHGGKNCPGGCSTGSFNNRGSTDGRLDTA